jgi:hypothetical protein
MEGKREEKNPFPPLPPNEVRKIGERGSGGEGDAVDQRVRRQVLRLADPPA